MTPKRSLSLMQRLGRLLLGGGRLLTVEATAPGSLEHLLRRARRSGLHRLRVVGRVDLADIRFLRSLCNPSGQGGALDGLYELQLDGAEFVPADTASTTADGLGQADGLQAISDGQLSGCASLERLTLPVSLDRVPAGGVAYCERLSQIEIPEGVTQVGPQAFNGCFSLRRVTLPSTLYRLGSDAFDQCDALEVITSAATVPPVIVGEAFTSHARHHATLIVPTGAAKAYRNAGEWGRFRKIVESTSPA